MDIKPILFFALQSVVYFLWLYSGAKLGFPIVQTNFTFNYNNFISQDTSSANFTISQYVIMIFTFCFMFLYFIISRENIQLWSYGLISYFISFIKSSLHIS